MRIRASNGRSATRIPEPCSPGSARRPTGSIAPTQAAPEGSQGNDIEFAGYGWSRLPAYVSGTAPVGLAYNARLTYNASTRQLTLTLGALQFPPDVTQIVTSSIATYSWPLGSPVSTADIKQF